LIGYQFDVEGTEPFFSVVFNVIKQISIVVFHDNTEVLVSALHGSISANNFHNKAAVEHVYNLNLSVFVFGILKYFFDSDQLSSFDDFTFVDFPKSPLPY
jgi:hypothetical protein